MYLSTIDEDLYEGEDVAAGGGSQGQGEEGEHVDHRARHSHHNWGHGIRELNIAKTRFYQKW